MSNCSPLKNKIKYTVKNQNNSYYIEKEYKAVRKQARKNKEIKRKIFS